MSVTLQSIEIINSLKESAEATTGESYANLTEAVQALKDGYGTGEGGSSDSADFVGVKYSEFDEDGYPTVADARSLGNSNINSHYIATGLLFNYSHVSGMNIRIKEVYLPDRITALTYSFQYCGQLEKLYGNFDKVTNLGPVCFGNCAALKELPYFPNVTSISSSALVNCTGLTSLKLYKKLTGFANNALTGCTNLTDIYVPWAEGEVANAPWGAPNENLIIHYNTTYDENHNPITEVTE